MTLLIILLLLWILPMILAANICEDRNRSPAKGVFLAVFFGWLAVIGLWLALKRRNPETLQLY